MRKAWALVVLLILSGCATYYQTQLAFNQQFEAGRLEAALLALPSEVSSRDRTAFLHFVNRGLVLSMMGRYAESNEMFQEAFLYGEDFRVRVGAEVVSFVTSPMVTPYRGEDHEHLLLLYYKALNFLKLGNREAALVECRRLNIRLQQLSDRYTSENKFQRDAFIHLLMGLIYDADQDYNNAFIAYRNAWDIYESDYQRMFQMRAPAQLRDDILRTAYLSGLMDEFTRFRELWGDTRERWSERKEGELVLLWHNGLGPVKAEWSLNFASSRQGDWLYFSAQGVNMVFPFPLRDYSEKERNDLASLEVFRVAFPRYVERSPFYRGGELDVQGRRYPLELAEDVNRVAFQGLQQRMNYELGKALIRVALKKAAEHELRKQDRTMGSLVGLLNAATEQADTRNWQSLPHSIYYARVPLSVGRNAVTLRLQEPGGRWYDQPFTYTVEAGQLLFHTFTSLESGYPRY